MWSQGLYQGALNVVPGVVPGSVELGPSGCTRERGGWSQGLYQGALNVVLRVVPGSAEGGPRGCTRER